MLPPSNVSESIPTSHTVIWVQTFLRKEGFERHALVCERHTGAGLTLEEIIERQLPVPHREMVPVTLEEQIICFADKFFSKTHLDEEKTVEKARKSIAKYGEEGSKPL